MRPAGRFWTSDRSLRRQIGTYIIVLASYWYYIGIFKIFFRYLRIDRAAAARYTDLRKGVILMTIDEMKQIKTEIGFTNEMIAECSGVPLSTVRKVFCGTTKKPRKKTVDALGGTLRRLKFFADSIPGYDPSGPNTVREPASVYNARKKMAEKKQGEYTLDDYYALPDERRVELIDGVIYDMAAPTLEHQIIIGEVHAQLRECIRERHADCTAFLSPCDVQLDKDDRTMVQPDVLVICGEFDKKGKRIYGAPDLTMEVLSPSTEAKDKIKKLDKYYYAGVREYWVIDPDGQTVEVHDFTGPHIKTKTYDFNSVIPVTISEGKCSIDFKEISRLLS